MITAAEEDLPVDPWRRSRTTVPELRRTQFHALKTDVMDTWATSSLSPQIVGRWPMIPNCTNVFTHFLVRPQAHEIIRTWAFYTIVKSHHHFGTVPWRNAVISGWGSGPGGHDKAQQEPRRRRRRAAGNDRELFGRCRALLGRQHRAGKRCGDQ